MSRPFFQSCHQFFVHKSLVVDLRMIYSDRSGLYQKCKKTHDTTSHPNAI
jgi:hypothetical protein